VNGDLVMSRRTVVDAGGSDLRLRSAGPIAAGIFSAHGLWIDTDGALPLVAGGAVQLDAAELQLDAGGPIGSALQPFVTDAERLSLSTRIDGAGIFVASTGSVTLGGTTIEVHRPDGQGGVQALGRAPLQSVDSAGDFVLDAAGTITVDAAGSMVASGRMTLNAADALTLQAGVSAMSADGMTLTAARGSVTIGEGVTVLSGTTSGALSITAGEDVMLAKQSDLRSSGGAIEVRAIAGTVTMDAAARMRSSGGDLSVRAEEGMEIGTLDAVTAGQAPASGGVITLRADGPGSRIVSAQAAAGVNARAAALRMQGYGLRLGEDGRALRVEAPVLDLAAPGGVLARQTQAHGETRHLAMVGDALYLQAASVGGDAIARGRVDKPDLLAPDLQPNLQPAAAPVNRVRPAGLWPTGPASNGFASLAAGRDLSGLASVVSLASAEVTWTPAGGDESDPGQELSRAFVLGSLASQPLQAGLHATQDGVAEYWLENLYL
jgi:hypothetical protein